MSDPFFETVREIKSIALGTVKFFNRRCPLCAADNREAKPTAYSLDVWSVISCQNCDFVYIDKAPVYEELQENIAWEKTTVIEAERRAKVRALGYKLSRLMRWRLHIFPRKNIPSLVSKYSAPGHVVDIGCGSGEQMRKLAPQYHPHGIEISKVLARQADSVFRQCGGQCINAPALEGLKVLPSDHFSAATLRSYLEHESRPLEVLIEVYRILKKGGVTIIKVPNYGCINRMVTRKNWCGFRYPDHQNYFTPHSLRTMAQKAGFDIFLSHWTFAMPTSDNMYSVLQK